MAYGQHQSFYLRDRWLNKAIKHIEHDPRFFYDKEAFEKIGLGKNMVNSLRFWVVATGVVSEEFNEERKKEYRLTELGKIIYHYDKFIQFQDTASILHYHLCRDREPSTVWYWFFNLLSENAISKEELLQLFVSWVAQNETKSVSDKSLKRDIECLVKLYTAGQSATDPEEVIQSPIHKINILEEHNGHIYKKSCQPEQIGYTALLYTLLDYKELNEVETITVDEITKEVGLWGKVFNMNRASIVNALEYLSNHSLYKLSFIRTNNLDNVRLPNITPLQFLKGEYKRKTEALV